MKIRGFLVACLVFLILAGILYWSEHRDLSGESSKVSAEAPPAILKLDQAAISRLDLKKKNAEPVLLAKANSGKWQISTPKPLGADQNAVSGMLFTLSSLKSERLVEPKAADLKPYGLDPPAMEVDITEKDNRTQKLLLGDDTPTGGAVYAALAGDPRIFTMSSFAKSSLDKGLNDLRDKRLLTVNSAKISRIELIRNHQEIEFGRNKDEWQILKPKPLRTDSLQVDELARKLTDAKMDLGGPAGSDAASAFARGIPTVAVKVTDESGTQELQIRRNKNTYYAKSSVVAGVYQVSPDLGQALDKGVDDFRRKQIFDFSFSVPNKVELHSGSKAYLLTRSGEDWWSNGKKMDTVSVDSLIAKLRGLTANRFVTSGFTNPTIEATVASDAGKQVEKVLICKSGDTYIAKREHESDLYQMDPSSIDDLQKAADGVTPATGPNK